MTTVDRGLTAKERTELATILGTLRAQVLPILQEEWPGELDMEVVIARQRDFRDAEWQDKTVLARGEATAAEVGDLKFTVHVKSCLKSLWAIEHVFLHEAAHMLHDMRVMRNLDYGSQFLFTYRDVDWHESHGDDWGVAFAQLYRAVTSPVPPQSI